MIEITAEGLEYLKTCIVGELDLNEYDIVEEKLIRDVKQGEFVKNNLNAKLVWIRGSYDRSEKRYELIGHNTESIRMSLRSGNAKVFVGFTY